MSAVAPDFNPLAPTGSARINIEKAAPAAILLGLIGVIVCIAMMFTGPKVEMMQSYLFAYIFWITVTLGCFGMLLFYHLIRGVWLLPVLRLLEAGGGPVMFLVMGLLLLPMVIPVAGGSGILYAWADATTRHSDLILIHKEPYLNPGFWTGRYVWFFASWIAISAWFIASTRRQEKSGDLRELIRRNNLSGPAFIYFVLSVTWAFTDWVMSLDAHWFSTMYGLWTSVAAAIGGFSFVVMIYCVNAQRQPYRDTITPKITRDMGNILFTLTMLWAYTSLSQYLIIWSGNLPETNFYYVERSKGSWGAVGAATIIGQFFLPFVMLLTPRNKKVPINLAKVAGFMLFVHLLDIYQYVVPAFRHTGPLSPLLGYDILALLSIGALWVGVFGMVTKRAPLLPSFDTRLEEEAHAH